MTYPPRLARDLICTYPGATRSRRPWRNSAGATIPGSHEPSFYQRRGRGGQHGQPPQPTQSDRREILAALSALHRRQDISSLGGPQPALPSPVATNPPLIGNEDRKDNVAALPDLPAATDKRSQRRPKPSTGGKISVASAALNRRHHPRRPRSLLLLAMMTGRTTWLSSLTYPPQPTRDLSGVVSPPPTARSQQPQRHSTGTAVPGSRETFSYRQRGREG